MQDTDNRIRLIKQICKEGLIGFGPSGGIRNSTPDKLFFSIKTDLIDLKRVLKNHQQFEINHCKHIVCGDTGKSCKIINIIIQLLQPSVVYEIGRYRGWSTSQIAYAIKTNADTGKVAKFVSIDPHIGAKGGDGWKEKQCGGLTEWEISKKNLEKAGIAQFVRLVKDYSQKFLLTVNDNIEFIFIDGDHTYEGAKADLEGYGNKMISGGIAVLHDVWGENFKGPNNGPCRVYSEVDETWEKLGIVWDVGILRKR